MHYAMTEVWHRAMVLLVLDLSEPALGLGTECFLPGITGSFFSKELVHRKISQRHILSALVLKQQLKYGQFRSQRDIFSHYQQGLGPAFFRG